MKHKLNLKLARTTTIILMWLMLGIGLTGCASNLTSIYLIDKQDIVDMSKGVSYTPDRDGRFYSLKAESQVMQVKVEKVKR